MVTLLAGLIILIDILIKVSMNTLVETVLKLLIASNLQKFTQLFVMAMLVRRK